MKKWIFRKDMLPKYINGLSSLTFQDAEDRLNYLENRLESLESIIEQAFKKGIIWKTNGEDIISIEDAIERAKKEILAKDATDTK